MGGLTLQFMTANTILKLYNIALSISMVLSSCFRDPEQGK